MGWSTGKPHRISGVVGGEITGQYVVVDKEAMVLGSVGAKDVVIHGEVLGTVSAQHITVSKGAHVEGELRYDSLTIEPGALVEARCIPTPRLAS